MTTPGCEIRINNKPVTVAQSRLTDSLLSVLRDDLGLTGTKEGCASGDCGACTIIAARPGLGIHTLNSCITPAGALAGGAVLTVEGLQTADQLHPVQQAMIDQHGAQCGFCTPGFVMSMVGDQLAREAAPTREECVIAVSGNLCRCTGYRPILDAAQSAWGEPSGQDLSWLDAKNTSSAGAPNYLLPASIAEMTSMLEQCDAPPEFIAGSTDAWLPVSQNYVDLPQIMDLSRIQELQGIELQDSTLVIGAGTTHAALLRYFSDLQPCRAITGVLKRFGSPQIRARGTIGGNIGNASPIADWPPILLTLDAQLSLLGADGQLRTVALEEFYTGYRQTVLRPGEIITAIKCCLPAEDEVFSEKISKRTEDDISSVLMATRLVTTSAGVLETVRVAYGGVAATPVRLSTLEDQLVGAHLATADDAQLNAICDQLDHLIQPISDVRAGAEYRLQMAKTLLLNALQEKRGDAVEDLQDV